MLSCLPVEFSMQLFVCFPTAAAPGNRGGDLLAAEVGCSWIDMSRRVRIWVLRAWMPTDDYRPTLAPHVHAQGPTHIEFLSFKHKTF